MSAFAVVTAAAPDARLWPFLDGAAVGGTLKDAYSATMAAFRRGEDVRVVPMPTGIGFGSAHEG